MKRLLATLLLAVVAGVLPGCTGAPLSIRITIDFNNPQHVPLPQLNSGTVMIDGNFYDIWCDLNGEVTLVVPTHAPGRILPVRPLDELGGPSARDGRGALPDNARTFDFGGASYAIMALPDQLMDFDLAGTAADLIDEHGVNVAGSMFTTTYEWDFDPVTLETDVRFAATSEVPLPDPFVTDLRYETIVVRDADDGPDFVYQRLVGPLEEVVEWLEAFGGEEASEAISDILVNVLSTSD